MHAWRRWSCIGGHQLLSFGWSDRSGTNFQKTHFNNIIISLLSFSLPLGMHFTISPIHRIGSGKTFIRLTLGQRRFDAKILFIVIGARTAGERQTTDTFIRQSLEWHLFCLITYIAICGCLYAVLCSLRCMCGPLAVSIVKRWRWRNVYVKKRAFAQCSSISFVWCGFEVDDDAGLVIYAMRSVRLEFPGNQHVCDEINMWPRSSEAILFNLSTSSRYSCIAF